MFKKTFSIEDTLTNFLSRPVKWLTVTVSIIGVLFPLYWLASNAFKLPQEYLKSPPILIPSQVTFVNFVDIFKKYGATKGLFNTVIIAVCSTIICVLFGSLSAYAIAKGSLEGKIRNIFILWFMVQKMYPAVSVAIPVYVVMRLIGLIDTRIALIIMNTSFNLPLVVWLMIGFFQEVPEEIEQSGVIDGCNMCQRQNIVCYHCRIYYRQRS